MLIIEKKRHGVNYATIWFADGKINKKGILQYRSGKKPVGTKPIPFDTLLSDLTESEEEIVARYSKNCRYEIRRAPKEGVTCEYKLGKELTQQDIEEFAQFFSDFWKSKGVEDCHKEKYVSEIREYAKAEAFAIATAKIGEKILVYHTYIVTEDTVRLYQSASQFRDDEAIPYQVIGMANRFLHKEDMLYFKQCGIKTYDWGGAGKSEEVASITKFKESFGGTKAVWYDGEETVGIMAKMLKLLIAIAGKVIK